MLVIEQERAAIESAVLENVGLTLDTQQGVNVAMFEYGPERVHMAVNGQGPAKVVLSPIATVAGGAMPITPGASYTVRIGEKTRSMTAGATSIAIPLVLAGEQEILVEAP